MKTNTMSTNGDELKIIIKEQDMSIHASLCAQLRPKEAVSLSKIGLHRALTETLKYVQFGVHNNGIWRYCTRIR